MGRKRSTEPLLPDGPGARRLPGRRPPKAGWLSLDRTKTRQLSYVVAYKLIQRLAKRAGQGDGCVGPVGSASRTCIGGSPGGYPAGRYPDL